jgi:hypothetical protein
MDATDVLARTRDAAALWTVGGVRDAELVGLACDLLVAGYDGEGLVALAAVSPRHAEEEVPGLLPAALAEVGVEFHPRDSPRGRAAAVRVMAGRTAAGALPPRALAEWVRALADDDLELAEHLRGLSYHYDVLEDVGGSSADLDAEVLAECARIAGGGGALRSRC